MSSHDRALSDDLCVLVCVLPRYTFSETTPIVELSKRTVQSTCCRTGGTQSGRACECSLVDSDFLRQRLSPQLLDGDSIANPTKKEQRPDRHVHKNGGADLCRNPKNSPTGGSSCCTTITIIICGSTPFIVLLFLLLLLILPLPVLDDDDCIHPTDSEPYNNNNNNNSYSVVDKRPSRSNNSKPTDTPSKQERSAFTSTTSVHVHRPR